MFAEHFRSTFDFLHTKTPSLIGVDVSSMSIKMVELSDAGKGNYRLERYAIEPLPKDVVTDGNIASLDQVSEAVNESCSLALLDGDDILYVARSVTSRIISVNLNIGSRLPAYCTSIGYVLLANLSPRALEDYLSRVELKPYTDRTITSKQKLRERLEDVRRNDYAIADQFMELSVRSLAVPVRNAAGNVVAGMNVIVQSGRSTLRDMKTLYLPPLQAAARELGAQLVP